MPLVRDILRRTGPWAYYTLGETVQLLLQQRPISPNAIDPPDSGTTALHLAASIGRADVVSLLLDSEEIDDTLRDAKGRTCREVAKTREVARIIQG